MPIRLRGHDINARPELISDPEKVQRLLELMASRSPTVKRFLAVPHDPDGHFDHERLRAAIGYGFRIIRWHLGAGAADDPERAQRPGSTP